MSAAEGGRIEGLVARREALAAEIQALARERAEIDDVALQTWRARLLREERGPDSANAHLSGYLRDMLRALEDARTERSRAFQAAHAAIARVARLQARRAALRGVLARAAALVDESQGAT